MSADSQYTTQDQDPDSEGCLCIVASYSDLASAVGPLAEEAAKRIMMSPALGDFIELRFRDIGSRPGHLGEHADAAVAVLAGELMQPISSAGQNYFALVIADTSAATAELLLRSCAADPVVADLPIRFRGIASSDDRQLAPESDQSVEIVVSPIGSWSRDAFIDELRSYGEELLRYFAAGHQPGLSPDELGLLRSMKKQRLSQQPGPLAGESGPSLERGQETVGSAEVVPALDVLTPEIATTHSRDSRVPEEKVHAIEEPSPASPQSPRASEEPSRKPEPELSSLPAQPPRSRRLWSPMARWRRGHEAEPEIRPGEVQTSGLVYLIITGDDVSSDHSAWHKGRSMLLDTAAKIAAAPPFAFKVRALRIGPDGVQGTLRAAGQLSRRDIKGPVTDSDFAAVLGSIRIMLKIDRTAIQAPAAPMAWPAVVFYATDPPLADTIAAEVYRELAHEASIIWVVPRDSADLMAPVFTEASDTLLLLYHQEVADEVVSLLTSTTRIRGANTEVHLLLSPARP
jgi:hypothetical protein